MRLGEDSVREFIKTIGLYRNKARNVIELSRQLIANHGGDVPRDREALEALPGVGRKTANVVLNVAFGEPTMAVDTHVFRVANRTGLSSGRDAAGGRGGSAARRARQVWDARAPLADPARALRVQGAQARNARDASSATSAFSRRKRRERSEVSRHDTKRDFYKRWRNSAPLTFALAHADPIPHFLAFLAACSATHLTAHASICAKRLATT